MEKIIHHGRNVKRFREMLGIKQGSFAADMGDEWTQDKISRLEQKEAIDDVLLEQIAGLLKVPVEAIKNFDEEAAVNIITSNFNDNATNNNHAYSTFHQNEDELMKLEEIKKLYQDLVREKDERIKLLERLLDGKK